MITFILSLIAFCSLSCLITLFALEEYGVINLNDKIYCIIGPALMIIHVLLSLIISITNILWYLCV